MAMNDDRGKPTLDVEAAKRWLQSDVTVRLRGWQIAAGGAVALLLLLAALD